MNKIVLLDGNSLMYRAFYATATKNQLMQNSKGQYTNCVYALQMMVEKILNQDFTHILVAFDKGKKTFRHDLYSEYKGGRKPMPEELKEQIPLVYEYFDCLNIKRYFLDLYEADDIIGTISNIAKNNDFEVSIYSSDKDLLQLINSNVKVNLLKKGMTEIKSYDEDKLKEEFNLKPSQIIDLKALMGDSSDNIKGIKGIGEKTAVKLINTYNDLEGIILHVDELKGKVHDLISDNIDEALKCKKIVTINQNSPVELTLDDLKYNGQNEKLLKEFYEKLEFHSLIKKTNWNVKENINFFYKEIMDVFELQEVLEKYENKEIGIHIEVAKENYHKSNILGIGLSDGTDSYFIGEDLINQSIFLELFLNNENTKKIVYDAKKTYVSLKKYNIDIKGISFDTLLAIYLINPDITTKQDYKIIVSNFIECNMEYDSFIYDKKQINADYKKHIAIKSYYNYKLKNILEELINKNDQSYLYYEIELPLSYVLAKMELNGLKVDFNELNKQKEELNSRISVLQEKIYELAGEKFNISSPKQLADILFNKLNLPKGKTNKTGNSTDINVLNELVDKHEIIKYLIEYRTITKLYNTYIIGIENACFSDGKVHSIYQQTLTQTGRLSSNEPNLQNIPIRTEEGHKIRKIFIPEYDYILSSDYSQIELRVLADIANVKSFIDAFNNNIDIHEKTAMDIFNKKEVSKEERNQAKTVNFGIIYGMSSYGLQKDLNITNKEAKNFIESYFLNYPEIKEYMDNIVLKATNDSYVETKFKRRRYIKELNNSNYMVKEFGKRLAMNTPIQGYAADILKKALVDIDKELEKRKLKSKLINTVHDEVILDCLKEELEEVSSIVIDKMENCVKLKVKLKVSKDIGTNWYETK